MVNFGKKSVLLSVLLASVSIVYVEAGKNGELRGRSFSQEEATTIIDVTSPESETLTLGETEMNAAQGGERALNGRAKEMKAMVTETTFEAPSTEVMDNFMTEHHMMKGVSLPMQKISKRNTIKVNGVVHSLDNLVPMNVFSSDATYLDEGVPKSLPMAATFMKIEGDSTMLVTKEGPRGNVKTIDITYTDGSNMYMEEVSNGMLAVMLPEARDKEAMKQFIMADPQDSGESGGTSSDPGRKLTKDYDSSLNENERHLQSGCSSLKVIDIAIAYDSSFCAKAGGSGNANNAVQQIVARVSTLYQNNFCGKIQISHMEGFCDPNTDPYAAGVRLNQSGCGNSGLLQFFSGYWSTNRGSVRRDAAHLFSGTGLECSNDGCVIGCANVANLCSSSDSYGVNYIAFSSDGQMQANLFAHELGHNAGSDHDSDTNGVEWIMEPSINSGTNGFSSQSRSSISNLLASSSCISTESPGGPSTSPVAGSPFVAAPVAAASVAAAPVAAALECIFLALIFICFTWI